MSAVSDRRRGLVERIRTGKLLRSGLCPVDGEPCDDDDDDDDAIAAATAAAAGLMLVPAAGTDTRSGMLINANNVLLSMIVISV